MNAYPRLPVCLVVFVALFGLLLPLSTIQS